MNQNSANGVLSAVADYYSAKLAQFGATPLGVDWNGEESQQLRFAQLVNLIELRSGFTLNDLGCGYGALFDYLSLHFQNFFYTGCDISRDMIDAATSRHITCRNATFVATDKPPGIADFAIASGIFNVRLGVEDLEWFSYLRTTLDVLDSCSRRGFSFNCLTSYSDSAKMQPHLYYADPCVIFDLCKRQYSRNVALLHDYGLYEFTVLVRKNQ